MVWTKKQTIWTVQIKGKLPRTGTFQLVASTRQFPHRAQRWSSTKVVESSPEKPCSLPIVFANEAIEIVAFFRQSGAFKSNVHTAPTWLYRLTPRVNVVKQTLVSKLAVEVARGGLGACYG